MIDNTNFTSETDFREKLTAHIGNVDTILFWLTRVRKKGDRFIFYTLKINFPHFFIHKPFKPWY
jgi:hypothetical protein